MGCRTASLIIYIPLSLLLSCAFCAPAVLINKKTHNPAEVEYATVLQLVLKSPQLINCTTSFAQASQNGHLLQLMSGIIRHRKYTPVFNVIRDHPHLKNHYFPGSHMVYFHQQSDTCNLNVLDSIYEFFPLEEIAQKRGNKYLYKRHFYLVRGPVENPIARYNDLKSLQTYGCKFATYFCKVWNGRGLQWTFARLAKFVNELTNLYAGGVYVEEAVVQDSPAFPVWTNNLAGTTLFTGNFDTLYHLSPCRGMIYDDVMKYVYMKAKHNVRLYTAMNIHGSDNADMTVNILPYAYGKIGYAVVRQSHFFSWTVVFTPFTLSSWAVLLFLFLASSGFLHLLNGRMNAEGDGMPLTSLFVIVLEQEVRRFSSKTPVRFFIAFFVCFALIATTVYRAKLSQQLGTPVTPTVITMEEILNDDRYKILSCQRENVLPNSTLRKKAKYVVDELGGFCAAECLMYTSKKSNFTVCVSVASALENIAEMNYCDNCGAPIVDVHHLEDSPTVYLSVKTIPYMTFVLSEEINSCILNEFATGLLEKNSDFNPVRNAYYKMTTIYQKSPEKAEEMDREHGCGFRTSAEVITLSQLKGVFYVFGFLLFVATCVFCGELYLGNRSKIVRKTKKRRQRNNLQIINTKKFAAAKMYDEWCYNRTL